MPKVSFWIEQLDAILEDEDNSSELDVRESLMSKVSEVSRMTGLTMMS